MYCAMRSTKFGARNMLMPGFAPTPVGSNPGMSGFPTCTGLPPTQAAPPRSRADQ